MNQNCIHLILSTDKMIAFCTAFKEWMVPSDACPKRCNRCVEGAVGKMEEVTQKKYELECLYFSRRLSGESRGVYYCSLYDQEAPLCVRCLFPMYIEDPKQNRVEI